MAFRYEYDDTDYNYDTRRPAVLPEYDYNGYNYGETSHSGLYGSQDRGIGSYHGTSRSFNEASNYEYGPPTPSFENPIDADRFRGPSPSSSFHMPNSPRPPILPYRPISNPIIYHQNFVPNGASRENEHSWHERRETRLFEPSATWKQTHGDRENSSHLSPDRQRLNEPDMLRRHSDSWRPSRYAPPHDDYRPNYYSGQPNYFSRDPQSVYTAEPHYSDESRADNYRSISRPSNPRPSALGDYKLQQRQASRRQDLPPVVVSDSGYKTTGVSGVDLNSRLVNDQKLPPRRGNSQIIKDISSSLEYRDSPDGFSAHKPDDRTSNTPSDSGSESSDSEASSFSVGSSIRTSYSSRSRTLIANQIHVNVSSPTSATNEYSKKFSHNISTQTRVKSRPNIGTDNAIHTLGHLGSPTRSSQQTEVESSITRVDNEEINAFSEAKRKTTNVSEFSLEENVDIAKDNVVPGVQLELHINSIFDNENEILTVLSPDIDGGAEPMSQFTDFGRQREFPNQMTSRGSASSLSYRALTVSGEVEKVIHRKESALEFGSHSSTSADGLRKALQAAITARHKYDNQTREQRINPILIANLSLAEKPSIRPSSSSEELVRDALEKTYSATGLDKLNELRPSLAAKFHERRSALSEKVQRLRQEYLDLNERWLAHCAKLDSAVKAGAMEETIPNLGRTTRRSTVNLGDAVRSDLEMERIIASLGNEDLTDPNHLAVRNVATVPDMISVEKGQVESFFDDTNGLVDDPQTFYDTRSGYFDWTSREEQIFLDKYGEFPKQFGLVSQYLPHKTTAQCVLYYYLHKKRLIDFRDAANTNSGRRRKGSRRSGKQKSNALLADIQERDKKKSDRGGKRKQKVNPATNSNLTSESTPMEVTPELESRAKRRRINTTSKIAEREASTSEVPRERKKPGRKPKKAKFVVVENAANGSVPETKFIDVNETLGRRKFSTGTSSWSVTDKEEFLILLARHGKNFKRIAASMPNKTTIQVNNYYKSHADDLFLDEIAANAHSRSSSTELFVHDPFVHGSLLARPLSATPLDGPLSGSMETMSSDIPQNSNFSADLTGNQHMWPSEQIEVNAQMHYRIPTESVQPQHRYMSILQPSMQGSAIGSITHSPSAASTLQFSAYPPPSLPNISIPSSMSESDAN